MKFICGFSILLYFSFAFSEEKVTQSPLSVQSLQPTQTENLTLSKIDSNSRTITKGNYIGGGLLGTAVGFGLGHAVQMRPDSDKMNFFMISEAGAIGGALLLLVVTTSNECTQGGSEEAKCLSSRRNRQNNILTLGALAYIGLRVWEIYDLWSYPYVTDKKPPQAAFYIHPQSTEQAAASFVINF